MTSSNPTRRDAGRERKALVPLYDYQREGVMDDARFCAYVWSRQTGKDFTVSLKHVRRRLKKGGDTICIAAGQRQTLQTIEKVKMHAKALEAKFDYEEIEFPGIDDFATRVIFKHNGARFLAMPANPDTVRGFSGDVWLNELAFMKHAMAMWKAAFAIATRGYSVDVSSTPNGQSGKFWDLAKLGGISPMGGHTRTHWTAAGWSFHWCDVHTAVAQGYPINVAEMKQAIDDEDTWLQEYELHFLADAENYIPLELLIACESEQATLELPANFQPQGGLYLGGDIGRKKDRSVFWLKEKIGDVKWTRAVITLTRTPFHAQWQVLDSLLSLPGMRRACLDASGLGMQLAEEAVRKYGSRVEAVTFNLENKERMATLQKKELEERRERIPSAAPIRRAFNAVKRYSSPTGHFRFDAERTDAGHADEFWASALATAAAEGAPAPALAGCDAPEETSRGEQRGVLRAMLAQRQNEAAEEGRTGAGREARGLWGRR
ncbi:MAG TPA: terminase family protein [Candidatus Nitrosotenuis sp.]|nr:terminase family protein [Candidatus Nitrosotenuis sp.]